MRCFQHSAALPAGRAFPVAGRIRAIRRLLGAGLVLAAALWAGPFAWAQSGGVPTIGIHPDWMNQAASPRQDLFEYANGRWLASTQIPADRAYYGIDGITQEKTQQQLRELVEGLAVQGPADPATPAGKLQLLYEGFIDEAGVEALHAEPLQHNLRRIDALKSRRQLAGLFAALGMQGVLLPLDLEVAPDERDARHYRVHLGQSELSLPDRDYYLDQHEARFRTTRAEFLKYAEAQLRRLALPHPRQAAAQILAFETRLAQLQWSRVENRDPVKTYNLVSFQDLKRDMPRFDWSAFLTGQGLPGEIDHLIVQQPSYLRGAMQLLQTTPLPVLQTWLRWQLLRASAPYLDHDLAQRHFAFESGVLRGVQARPPRWKSAVMLSDALLGEALGQLYVERYFPTESRDRIHVLVDHLMAAYADSIDHLDWLGPETRAAAKVKLAMIRVKLGYPDRWRDYSALEIRPHDLLGNVERAIRFENLRQTARLSQPVDRDEWGMTPQTVNAYYNPNMNEIVFPAAQLQAPYFDAKADDAANYGNIGFVIGHELSHAFDDEGSQFDGEGNLKDWWTEADHKRFAERTAALVAQYGAVSPLPGVHVNGELTLGENIADNAGLTIAWKAYQTTLAGQDAPLIEGLSGAQRFYISYAQSWLGKNRETDLVRQLKTDPHAPLAVRTNQTVRNQDAFYRAFGVQAGDAMWLAPEARVHLW